MGAFTVSHEVLSTLTFILKLNLLYWNRLKFILNAAQGWLFSKLGTSGCSQTTPRVSASWSQPWVSLESRVASTSCRAHFEISVSDRSPFCTHVSNLSESWWLRIGWISNEHVWLWWGSAWKLRTVLYSQRRLSHQRRTPWVFSRPAPTMLYLSQILVLKPGSLSLQLVFWIRWAENRGATARFQ